MPTANTTRDLPALFSIQHKYLGGHLKFAAVSVPPLECPACPARLTTPHSVNSTQLLDLPYHADSCDWFLRIRSLGRAVWLDSAFPHSQRGRYDILSAAPLQIVEAAPDRDLFTDLRGALDATFDKSVVATGDLPFQGGAIGLFDYESGRRLENLAVRSTSSESSKMGIGLYSWAIVSDHKLKQTQLLVRPETPPSLRQALLSRLTGSAVAPKTSGRFSLTAPWRENFTYPAYAAAFDRLQDYIRAGDCYQVNLARRFQSTYSGDPLTAYLAARSTAAAPFSAYLETDCTQVGQSAAEALLCFSPERFLSAQGRELFTQPIKGTSARATDPTEDHNRAQALLGSDKNRAENLMIVDLLRNDLGHSCDAGSIHVEQLFELQSFTTVHHLVSSIRGTLRADLHPLDALRHCFPGGSITGAPKHRAMQIIDELEPYPRAAFCGAIGYLSLCGRMDSNITIRTLQARGGEILAWAGGGIVADSDCEEEFQETRSKIEPLLRALAEIKD